MKDKWEMFKYNKFKGIRSFSDILAIINFRLWRWYFTRFKLPKLIGRSYDELRAEYTIYKVAQIQAKKNYSSFEDWCGRR